MKHSDSIGHLTTEELFRQHAGFVARMLARFGVRPDQIEDALQEVFLVVHRQGGYRPGLAKPTSYLAGIAIRTAAQHRRRQGIALARHSDAGVDFAASAAEDPDQALQVGQDLERLQRALDRLPEDLRTILLLVDVEGESSVSVAAGLGCPVGTVYWRLHQARKKLQSALAKVDATRQSPQTEPAPAHFQQRAARLGALIMLPFQSDFHKSEAARLLRLARDSRAPSLPVEDLLARHQQLVQSGAQLPAWASELAPQTASWVSVIGVGPVAVGAAAAGAAMAVALTLSIGGPPPPAAGVGGSGPAAVQGDGTGGAPAVVAAAGGVTAQASKAHDPTVVGLPVRANAAPDPEGASPDPETTAPASASAAVAARPRSASGQSRDPVRGSNAHPGQTVGRGHGQPAARRPSRHEARGSTSTAGGAARPQSPVAPQSKSEAGAEARPRDGSPMRRDARSSHHEPALAARAEPNHDEPAPRAAPEPPTDEGSDPTLAEMRELARAERLLASDPGRALAMVRQMRSRFRRGYFVEERAYVEVMALDRLGRSEELLQRASVFLREYPAGPYTARVRSVFDGHRKAAD